MNNRLLTWRFGVTGDCSAIAVLSCLLLAGCALPKRTTAPSINPSTLDDTAFLHYLASAPIVTVEEGIRGVLLLRGETDRWPSYEQQVDELVRLGAVKRDWKLTPDDTLDMGTLAFLLRVICHLPPSFSERAAMVLGVGQHRYALRTCIDANLLPASNASQAVQGGELAAALAKAEKFLGPVAAQPTPTDTDGAP